MRTLRKTALWALGLTALFGMAQVGAAVFLIQRFESHHPFTSLERVLLIGLVLLMVGAEMMAAAGGIKTD